MAGAGGAMRPAPPTQRGPARAEAPQGGEDEDYYDRLKAFLGLWGLDASCAVDLMRCSREQQQEAMGTFSPGDEIRDVSAQFRIFVQRYLSGPGGGGAVEERGGATAAQDPLELFVQTWSLNEDALNRLRELPPRIQQEVMASFDPPQDTRDVNAKLISFARAKLQYYDANPLLQFAQTWGLNEDAVGRLRELPAELQTEVMASFAPPPDTRNVSAKFISFVKAKTLHNNNNNPLESFVRHFGLNEDAVRWLQGLPVEQQAEAMASFAPPADTRNVSAKFISYVKAKVSQPEGAAWAEGTQANALEAFTRTWGLNEDALARLREIPPSLQEEVMASFSPPPNTRDLSGKFISFVKAKRTQHHAAEPFERFTRGWGLNEDAVRTLLELAPEEQQEVMASFKPASDTRDFSARFISFVRRRKRGLQATGFAELDKAASGAVASPWKRQMLEGPAAPATEVV